MAKYAFMVIGSCSVIMLLAASIAICIGIPIEQKEVTKYIRIK